jgi:hypothetical protein
MHLPSVSTIIPTYNRAHLVTRAVESALLETEEGDEIIVVDDGSTDRTEEALAPYLGRIQYFRLAHQGCGKTRNFGIGKARNPLIAFLDSDDEWMRGKLRLQRSLMNARPEVVFCFSDFAVRYRSGEIDRRYLFQWHRDSRPWEEILGQKLPLSALTGDSGSGAGVTVFVGNLYLSEMSANYVFTSTLMVRKDLAGPALRFSDDLPIYEDWECYGKLAGAGPAAYLDTETAWQVAHGGTRLTDSAIAVSADARIKVLERVWGSDPSFLASNRAAYDALIREQRQAKVRSLLAQGRAPEAREELRRLDGATLYHLLAALPAPLVKWLAALRRSVFRRT